MLRKKLTLHHGAATLRLSMAFDEGANAGDFNTAMAALIRQERALKASPSEAVCALYGQAAEGLYRLVLGEENARAVLAFYGEDALAMVNDVHPFIRNIVAPAVAKASARSRRAAVRDFKAQRRKAVRA